MCYFQITHMVIISSPLLLSSHSFPPYYLVAVSFLLSGHLFHMPCSKKHAVLTFFLSFFVSFLLSFCTGKRSHGPALPGQVLCHWASSAPPRLYFSESGFCCLPWRSPALSLPANDKFHSCLHLNNTPPCVHTTFSLLGLLVGL